MPQLLIRQDSEVPKNKTDKKTSFFSNTFFSSNWPLEVNLLSDFPTGNGRKVSR